MLSPVLAFRPATVRGRLPSGSDACPLSTRDLLPAAGAAPLPLFAVPDADIALAVLVAAKVQRSAVALSLPPDVPPDRWFDGMVRAADQVAAGFPVVLSAEVAVGGEGGPLVDRATAAVWRLLDAGVTHLAFEVEAVAPEERGRVLSELIGPVAERGLGVECILPLGGDAAGARRAVALVAELDQRGTPLDAASVRCSAPRDAEVARAQVGVLSRLAQALGGVPVLRRGPVAPPLFGALSGAAVRGCEDGGLVAAAARGGEAPPGGRGAEWTARAEAAVGGAALERLEARAFVAAAETIDALRAGGSAVTVVRALERRLAEDGR